MSYNARIQDVTRLRGGGVTHDSDKKCGKAALPLYASFRCGYRPVNRPGSLRTRENEKDESDPPKTGGTM